MVEAAAGIANIDDFETEGFAVAEEVGRLLPPRMLVGAEPDDVAVAPTDAMVNDGVATAVDAGSLALANRLDGAVAPPALAVVVAVAAVAAGNDDDIEGAGACDAVERGAAARGENKGAPPEPALA